MSRRIVGAFLALAALGCEPSASAPAATGSQGPLTVPTPSPTPSLQPTRTPHPITFSVDAVRARYVATTMTFFDAFNTGKVDAALALLTDDVSGGDCDYRAQQEIRFRNKADAGEWLRARRADHDRIEVTRIFNENPAPSTGGRVVGVVYRRENDSLRQRGEAERLSQGAAKLVFSPDGLRLIAISLSGCP